MIEPAYYNEHDLYAAQWLRNLIAAGHIAPGDVDTRSIEDVKPDDLRPYTQCHFFAGIGVWSAALRRAGWPDDQAIWTGSCPCQPFSAAGAGAGFDDERHLWPAWHWLIAQRRPELVLGEQVASGDGLKWLDLVSTDLEGTGYTTAATDICAAGVGAPHIRQRLFFLAHTSATGFQERIGLERILGRAACPGTGQAAVGGGLCAVEGMGHTERERAGRNAGTGTGAQDGALVRAECDDVGPSGAVGDVEHASGHRCSHRWPESSGWGSVGGCGIERVADADGGDAGAERQQRSRQYRLEPQDGRHGHTGVRPGPTNGLWGAADWLGCRDGKWRPVEPGTFPLAHGAASRVGRLRAYGNAINVEAARVFIDAAVNAMREYQP